MAVVFPVALAVVLGIVQGGLLWDARNALLEAAQAGVTAGRVVHGTSADAEEAALSYLNRAASDDVTAPGVSAHRGVDTIMVTTTGTAQKLLPIPGIELRIRVGSSAPVERFSIAGSSP
ncbi:hypothetical protein GCM10025762_42100 [Haloechinothrix salitolerans]